MQGPHHARSRRAALTTRLLVGVAFVLATIAAAIYFMPRDATAPQVATVAAAAPSATPTATPAVASATPSAAPSPAPATTAPPADVTTYADWVLVCPKGGPAIKCAARQQAVNAQGRPVILWSIERDSAGSLHASWITPAGVVRASGFVLDIGQGDARSIPFAGCSADACSVRAAIAPDYRSKLEAAPTVSAIVVTSADNKPHRFALSPKGLLQVLAALDAKAVSP